MMIPPLRAIGWTVLGILVTFWSPGPHIEFVMALSIVGLSIVTRRRFQPAKFFILTSLPFLVPLLIIHGSLNPQFPSEARLWALSYRPDGVIFALTIYSRLSILFALAAAWAQVNRDELFDWMIARRVPVFLVGLVGQSIAMVVLIEKRGNAVLMAQSARGIPTGPSLWHRFRALPSVLLPVVTSLINEADQRSTVLWSRGFLEYRFAARKLSVGPISETGWLTLPLLVAIITHLLWRA